MVRLSCEICGFMVIFLSCFKGVVPCIAPKDSCHAELMRKGKRLTHLYDLTSCFRRAEINGGSHCNASHIVGLLYRCKKDLVIGVRIRNQFIVVELKKKRDLMSVFSSYGS